MKAFAIGGNVDVIEPRRQVLPVDLDGGELIQIFVPWTELWHRAT